MKPSMDIGSSEWKTVIIDGGGQLGIEVSEEQAGLFAVHAREMVLWNKSTNLTSVADPFEMAVKHYLDSMAAVPYIGGAASLLDAGSGGGFPGIPLKIMLPSLKVTLLDARRKRVSFLKHVIRSLGIAGIDVFNDRLEQMKDQLPPGEGFDVVVSRAFSDLKAFAAHALPLLNPGGCLVAYKGKRGEVLENEVAELEKMATENKRVEQHREGRGLHIDMQSIVLSGLELSRTLVIISC
ncbi:MAG: 16S rRNA (guanine(527)-N(7))-methyltransferase RsmG [Thermodesulfobacteriota bacterium]